MVPETRQHAYWIVSSGPFVATIEMVVWVQDDGMQHDGAATFEPGDGLTEGGDCCRVGRALFAVAVILFKAGETGIWRLR